MTFRKKTGSIVCPHCGRLISVNAPRCPFCDTLRPGGFGFGPSLLEVTKLPFRTAIFSFCILFYVISLLITQRGVDAEFSSFFSPSTKSLISLGAAGVYTTVKWSRWETLITAIFLHGSVLHILFNMLWFRHLAPVVEEFYDAARFFLIFILTGIAGNLASIFVEQAGTLVGASGSVFGLFGALIWYGYKRGGVVGSQVFRFGMVWAGIGMLLSFMPGMRISWAAHAGGLAAGFFLGSLFGFKEQKRSGLGICLAALIAGIAVLAAFSIYFFLPPPELQELFKR